jgi:uncharacterized BrkB/YihY/UPF0761 family membrane protein
MWFAATLLSGWYLNRYADYNIIYGSLVRRRIALLSWMYLVSFVVLVNAEFDAMLFHGRLRVLQRLPESIHP